MIRFAMALVMALVVPTVVMAKGECKEDKRKFCKDVFEAKGDMGACLEKHLSELSEACKTKLAAKSKKPAKEKKAGDAGNSGAAGAEGAAQ
jgi:hypothetical protein